MRTHAPSLLLVAALLTSAAAAQAQSDPLAARADSDRAFLDRARTALPTSAFSTDDSARVRLAHLDSTYTMLIAAGRSEAALAFAVAMNPQWTRLGNYSSALANERRALGLSGPLTANRAAAIRQTAFLAFRGGDSATARVMYQQLIDLGTELPDTAAIVSGQGGLARVAARGHDFRNAIKHALAGVQLAASYQEPRRKIGPYHVLAFAHRLAGDYEEAARIYEYTIGLYGITGNSAGAAGEMFNLGFVRLHQRDTASAGRLFRESLTALRSAHSTDQMYLLGAFAALAAAQDRPRRAALLYGAMNAAIASAHVVLDPDDQGELDTYSKLAKSRLHRGEFNSAWAEGAKLSPDAAAALALSKY